MTLVHCVHLYETVHPRGAPPRAIASNPLGPRSLQQGHRTLEGRLFRPPERRGAGR